MKGVCLRAGHLYQGERRDSRIGPECRVLKIDMDGERSCCRVAENKIDGSLVCIGVIGPHIASKVDGGPETWVPVHNLSPEATHGTKNERCGPFEGFVEVDWLRGVVNQRENDVPQLDWQTCLCSVE